MMDIFYAVALRFVDGELDCLAKNLYNKIR